METSESPIIPRVLQTITRILKLSGFIANSKRFATGFVFPIYTHEDERGIKTFTDGGCG